MMTPIKDTIEAKFALTVIGALDNDVFMASNYFRTCLLTTVIHAKKPNVSNMAAKSIEIT